MPGVSLRYQLDNPDTDYPRSVQLPETAAPDLAVGQAMCRGFQPWRHKERQDFSEPGTPGAAATAVWSCLHDPSAS